MTNTRPVSWIKAARKDFFEFPADVQREAARARALTVIAERERPDFAKPMTGFGSGIWELALRHRGDAFRVVYAIQLAEEIWVIHAFFRKSRRAGSLHPRPRLTWCASG